LSVSEYSIAAMDTFATLCGRRVRLRPWRIEDREAFAAMNSDPRVMEFFRSPLTRADSDAMADRIDRHFNQYGFGLWVIEVPGLAPFIGFAGLIWAQFSAHFTPAVEIGWRIAFDHWRHGYATEAARLALDFGFEILALEEVVSFTAAGNLRSRAVMERLGMRRDPGGDFDYPGFPQSHPLRRHVLYRIGPDSHPAGAV
jgi:ribosomal-protein-alanine N-acetyltransferase